MCLRTRQLGATKMWVPLLLVLTATSLFVSGKVARQNGDLLRVGEKVRIRLLVEQDYYFGVVACGEHQCGGVRVEGVDWRGMGYMTFISNATNHPFRAKWVIKNDFPFGTTFNPGTQYTFVVARPAQQEMQLWIEGQEQRVASIKLGPGDARLHVGFRNGDYRFIGDSYEATKEGRKLRSECTGIKEPSTVKVTGTDVLEVKVGCRYESEDKVQSMCVIYLEVDGVKGRREVYRSTLSRNEYEPEQEETLQLPFQFEEKQYLVLEVYKGYTDCDTPDNADLLGTLKTPLASVNTKGNVEMAVTEESDGNKYSARFQRNCDERITLQFSGRGLPGEGDVFLQVVKTSAKKGQGTNEDVEQTNKVTRDLDLVLWDEMSLSVNALCDGDYDRTIRVYAMESDRGETTLIGYFNTTMNELKQPRNNTLLLMNHAQQARLGNQYNHSGEIRVGEVLQDPTFSQYVAVGFELVGTTQIDFTASNNDPVPSLHNFGGEPNKYEIAIKAVGEVIEDFIASRTFKAYGFGVNFNGEVSHDFSMNLDSSNPDCVGVTGVLETYHKTVQKLWAKDGGFMEGPTYFAPGLSKVVEMARQYKDGSKYFVHLLLTDGELHDPEETKKVILEASSLPISIIMIGIGDADFSKMKTLATDTEAKEARTGSIWNKDERGMRDIVQFVAIKDFVAADAQHVSLRRKVLSKIPPQYLEYMKIKKIPPKPVRNFVERYCA